MNKIYLFSKIIVFVLSGIGIIIAGITAHELKHFYDLKENAEITEICVMNIPITFEKFSLDSGVGYVRYYNNGNAQSEEFLPNIISIVVVIILTNILSYYIFESYDAYKEMEDF